MPYEKVNNRNSNDTDGRLLHHIVRPPAQLSAGGDRQFSESVNRSITRVSHNMEFEETRRGLINDAKNYIRSSEKVSKRDTMIPQLNNAQAVNTHMKKDTTTAPMLETMPGMPPKTP